MKKIVTVIGARPQFIKAAVMSRLFSESDQIKEVLVHTGQHYDKDMSDVFFDELEIPKPKYNLAVQERTHGAMTGLMLLEIERVLLEESPDYLLVYGDTNSTLAGALAAEKLNIPIIHIEAGLRSFNRSMPEEINRILTDRMSALLCCPTKEAISHLSLEGMDREAKVVLTGDIMADSVEFARSKDLDAIRTSLGIEGAYVFMTCHRQENVDQEDKLRSIVAAANEIARQTRVIWALHPRTAKRIDQWGIECRVDLIAPCSYFETQSLLAGATLVLTDSGGLQKEAYFHEKYSIVLREQTEWVELLDLGVAELAGCHELKILQAYDDLKNKNWTAEKGIYGKDVGQRIKQEILQL